MQARVTVTSTKEALSRRSGRHGAGLPNHDCIGGSDTKQLFSQGVGLCEATFAAQQSLSTATRDKILAWMSGFVHKHFIAQCCFGHILLIYNLTSFKFYTCSF